MISLGFRHLPGAPARSEQEGMDLYEGDFHAWTQNQAARLRMRARTDNALDVDWENVAEEIESLGRSDRRELASRLGVLLQHLLKWSFQPDARSSGWRGTVREQRHRIGRILRESPSLRQTLGDVMLDEYPHACESAAEETGLSLTAFPTDCPFTLDEILDPAFLPEAA